VDQIIKVISERLGVSQSVVREAIKVLLEFAKKRTAGTKFEKLLAEIPGASALLAETPSVTPADGGGLLSGLGSLAGSPVGDAAKAFSGLRSAGLQSAQIGPFVQAFLEKSREIAGPETVDEILKQLPILKVLVKS